MNKIREYRKKKGVTMKELGKAVGVSESTISLYETGKHEPDLLTLGRIADFLEVTIDELLGREPEEQGDDWPWPEDETLLAFGRAMKNMSPEKREKIMQMARVMFAEDFPDAP